MRVSLINILNLISNIFFSDSRNLNVMSIIKYSRPLYRNIITFCGDSVFIRFRYVMYTEIKRDRIQLIFKFSSVVTFVLQFLK